MKMMNDLTGTNEYYCVIGFYPKDLKTVAPTYQLAITDSKIFDETEYRKATNQEGIEGEIEVVFCQNEREARELWQKTCKKVQDMINSIN